MSKNKSRKDAAVRSQGEPTSSLQECKRARWMWPGLLKGTAHLAKVCTDSADVTSTYISGEKRTGTPSVQARVEGVVTSSNKERWEVWSQNKWI